MFIKAAAFLSLAANKAAAVVVKLNVLDIYSFDDVLPMFMFDLIFLLILPSVFFEPPDALLLD